MKKLVTFLVLFAVTALSGRRAAAADPWVERRLTLPSHDWSFDFGLGVGHAPAGGRRFGGALTGAGVNFEFAVAPIHHLELGLRSGGRFGDEARLLRADTYGRLFDHETFGTGVDTFANPEFRIRGELVDVEVFELALEGRAILPFEEGTRFGAMFGVPLGIHIGNVVRFDTGAFVPVLFYSTGNAFYDATVFAIDFPFDAWFQVTEKLWLGPMLGFRHTDFQRNRTEDDIRFGFGLGYQVASFVDLKTQIVWPGVNHDRGAEVFGVGFGVQLRIE